MGQSKEQKKYTITVNDAQAEIIENALEEYFRLRLGQFNGLTHDLAFYDFNTGSHTNEEFDECIRRRNAILEKADEIKRIAWPLYGHSPVSRTMRENNAIDIWHVIQHGRYLANGGDPNANNVMADTPRPTGEYPLPKFEERKN